MMTSVVNAVVPGLDVETHAVAVPFPALSTREREVALRLAVGDTCREIAKSLEISVKTVDTHRGHILKKLACRHNVDLARYAIRMGYLPA